LPDAISGTLTRNWLRFGLILRGLGFDAGPARMLPYLQALTLVDQRRREDVAAAVHAHFARRRDDFAVLDRALGAFLLGADPPEPRHRSPVAEPGDGDGSLSSASGEPRQLNILDDADEAEVPLALATYSAAEVLRHKDFAALSDEEMRAVRRLIQQMVTPAGRRESSSGRSACNGRSRATW